MGSVAVLSVHVVGGHRAVRPFADNEHSPVIVDEDQRPFLCRRLVTAGHHRSEVVELALEFGIEA